MHTFSSTVWDRLNGTMQASTTQQYSLRLSLAQYRQAIARDLEVLLNTRVAITAEELDQYPVCKESIVNFGLADFAQLCLTSSEDRKEICDRLVAAIARHEPRLAQVRAQLVEERGVVNRLSFKISARLFAQAGDDPVQFNILLEPSSLHYVIR